MTAPSVPKHIIEAIVAYGDARADGLTGSTHIVDAIQGIRELLAGPQSSDEQPRYNYGPDGRGPVSLLNGDRLRDQRALQAAAKAVENSAAVWEGFAMQDAKTCVQAYCAALPCELIEGISPTVSETVQPLTFALGVLTEIAQSARQDKEGGYQAGGVRWGDIESARRAVSAMLNVAPTSAAEEPFEMPLCESRKVTLQIGRAYRFVPVDYCDACQAMRREHDEAYGVKS